MKQFTENGKIGFVDTLNRVILEAQFDAVDTFQDPNGHRTGEDREWAVQKDGKWGLIDSQTGRWITPCTWEAVECFQYGIIAKVKWCGRWGFINRNGVVVTCCQWDKIESFANRGAAARAWRNGKVNYIFINGTVMFDTHSPFKDLQFDAVDTFYDPDYYRDYLEQIGGHPGIGYEFGVLKDGKWGLINYREGKWITPCQWESVSYFKRGLAKVKQNGKWGFVDTEGKLAIPCRWEEVDSFSWDRVVRVKRDGKWGYMDTQGNEVLPCEWEAVVPSYDKDWLRVKRHGIWHIRDSEGNLFTPGEKDKRFVFHEGLAQFYDGSGYGLIDREGREVIACRWDEICRVAQDAGGFPWKRGPLIDWWSNRTEYPYKLIKVRRNRKWGIYDLTGKECYPCTLDKIWRFRDGVAKICEDGKWGLIDEQGRVITPCQWEYVDDFRGGEAAVRLNKHWGTIDRNGNLVRPCTCYVGLWRNE